jgi:hypothetical protein
LKAAPIDNFFFNVVLRQTINEKRCGPAKIPPVKAPKDIDVKPSPRCAMQEDLTGPRINELR